MLQSVALGYIFEEARRQGPFCSWALNWDFNDSWPSAANCSIVEFPANPKPAYFRVKEALASVTPSIRHEKFTYQKNEAFKGEIVILNDSDVSSKINKIDVYLEANTRIRIASFDVKDGLGNINVGEFSIPLDNINVDGLVNPAGNALLSIILSYNGKEKSYPFLLNVN